MADLYRLNMNMLYAIVSCFHFIEKSFLAGKSPKK